MKITRNRSLLSEQFATLEVGKTFKYDGHLYLKVKTPLGAPYNAISLELFTEVKFSQIDMVTPVESELIVKG